MRTHVAVDGTEQPLVVAVVWRVGEEQVRAVDDGLVESVKEASAH